MNWAKEKNRKVFWNPGKEEIQKIKKGVSLPKQGDSLSYAPDVLQINRQEASEFFGVDFISDEVWKSKNCPTVPQTILLITDGARGGRVCHQGKCTWYQGVKTQMVDSTGAGDAFGSGFVAALMSGKQIEEAIEWGRKQAAGVVEHIGAKEGLIAKF